MVGLPGVGTAALTTLGLAPDQMTITGDSQQMLGDFVLRLPQNGRTFVTAIKTGYFQSYNEVTTSAVNVSGAKLFIAPASYINSLALAAQVDLNAPFSCRGTPLAGQQCVYGIILGRITDDGTLTGRPEPVGGIAGSDISVLGGPNQEAWAVNGPLFLDVDGTPNRAALTSIANQDPITLAYRGGLFALFVEVAATTGPIATDFQISIQHAIPGGGSKYYGPIHTKAFRPYGVTWTTVPETGTPPPMVFNNIDFDSQVYPLFLPISQGGLGCQGCHTNLGGATPSGGMNLFGGPEVAYQALNPAMNPTRVNTANPAASLLLVRPLYETNGAQDHPIFAFTSPQDPGYKTILAWITEGGRRSGNGPAVSFARDVLPILANPTQNMGAGCVACHGVATNPPGGFSVLGAATDVYNALTTQAAMDDGRTGEPFRVNKTPGNADRSLVLLNPLYGSPEPHPVKLFSGTSDPRYVVIYRWIQQGFQNN